MSITLTATTSYFDINVNLVEPHNAHPDERLAAARALRLVADHLDPAPAERIQLYPRPRQRLDIGGTQGSTATTDRLGADVADVRLLAEGLAARLSVLEAMGDGSHGDGFIMNVPRRLERLEAWQAEDEASTVLSDALARISVLEELIPGVDNLGRRTHALEAWRAELDEKVGLLEHQPFPATTLEALGAMDRRLEEIAAQVGSEGGFIEGLREGLRTLNGKLDGLSRRAVDQRNALRSEAHRADGLEGRIARLEGAPAEAKVPGAVTTAKTERQPLVFDGVHHDLQAAYLNRTTTDGTPDVCPIAYTLDFIAGTPSDRQVCAACGWPLTLHPREAAPHRVYTLEEMARMQDLAHGDVPRETSPVVDLNGGEPGIETLYHRDEEPNIGEHAAAAFDGEDLTSEALERRAAIEARAASLEEAEVPEDLRTAEQLVEAEDYTPAAVITSGLDPDRVKEAVDALNARGELVTGRNVADELGVRPQLAGPIAAMIDRRGWR